MQLKPGDRIDRFVVDGIIGVGGTATVYRVRHERLGTVHALKILAVASQAIRDRLVVEGQAQATMNHPNIVSVTDILDLDGSPGLLMEHIEGPSLEDALLEYDFSLADKESLFLGILDGVEVAHAQGLVHRDLKLANVLLAPSPAGFVPKITDFGLAKVLYHKVGVAATQSGVAMGTPGFMAPEQVRDAGQVDQRADLFSLGCILYEMVSGERTFPGDEVLQIYINVTKANFIPVRQHVPDLPDRFDTAIRGMLQKERDDRIPDVPTLRRVLTGEIGWDKGPVAAPPQAAAAPVAATPAAEKPAQPARSTGDRVLPVLLMGGSVALLGFVLLFATLVVGVPLLLGPTGPSEPIAKVVPEPATLPEVTPTVVPAAGAVPIDPEDVAEPVLADDEPAPRPEFETPIPRVRPRPKPAPVAPPPPPAPVPAPPPEPRPEFENPYRPRLPPPAPAPAPVAAPAPQPEAIAVAVKIYSRPPSAAVLVDGHPTGLRTPNKINLLPGSHRVDLRLSGYTDLGLDILAGTGQPGRWCVDFLSSRTYQGACPR
jgi:hypothetical protein